MQAARGASLTGSHAETPRRRTALVLVLGLALLAVDQVAKVVAVRELTGREPVEVVGSLLRFVLVYNPGAAFGVGSSITPVITVVALVATVVILWQALRVRHLGWAVALGLLLAGVTGNLADRLVRDPDPFRGHVVDFLALPNWPVFNTADVFINVAGVIIVVLLFRGVGVDGSRDTHREVGEEAR